MHFDSKIFLSQLAYWSRHCLLNALPSFIIASKALNLWKQPIGIAAMLAAIATFIILYSLATSWTGPFSNPSHPLCRSMKVGTKIRGVISIISIPTAFTSGLLFIPDFWCGYAAMSLLSGISVTMGHSVPFFERPGEVSAGFLPVYATTMLEGFILSFILLMISFFALLIIHAKDRRKAYNNGSSFDER